MKKILFITLSLMIFGCSSTQTGIKTIEEPKEDKDKKKRPDWLKKEQDSDKKYMYIKATSIGEDRDWLKQVANKSGANTKIISLLNATAEEKLSFAFGNGSKEGESLQNALSKVTFSGLILIDSYWEIIEQYGTKKTYEVYCWYKIPHDELAKAKARAWNESFTNDVVSKMDTGLRNKLEDAKREFYRNN